MYFQSIPTTMAQLTQEYSGTVLTSNEFVLPNSLVRGNPETQNKERNDFMNVKKIDLGLSGYEELFMSEAERKENRLPRVHDLELTQIDNFEGHPFQIKEDAEMNQLVESIREHGVLVPGLVRQNGERYELVSGHRRKRACEILGLPAMPVVIRDMSREEAIIAMVDSNIQREHILPSEKAFAYKMKMDALAHQGKASRQVGEKWSVAKISEDGIDSERQVHRFIRLTNLIPEILQMVDEGRIALTPAVELSYLQQDEQQALHAVMEELMATPSLSQAQRLRRMSEGNLLTESDISTVLGEVKGNQQDYVKLPAGRLRSFFKPNTSSKEMTDTLIKAMEFYNRHLERQRRDRDAR